MTNGDTSLALALTLLVKHKLADIDKLTESISNKCLFEYLGELYQDWTNQNNSNDK
jgi:hypothetical protein